ncbi:MAG: DEAD/DEAH box helicase [Acidimicrobiia bacterium]
MTAAAPQPSPTPFSPVVADWFAARHGRPTRIQAEGWDTISAGGHALLVAPTGTGKTLASFLWAIDRLLVGPPAAAPGVRLLYISPLKALNYDIERNLEDPLAGVRALAAERGTAVADVRVGVRTGDTSQSTRASILRRPPEILITTPESLYLLLTSERAREILRTIETVVVDEIHAIASSKRGTHLALSLERLEELTPAPPQRIGLSATVRPAAPVAELLAGFDRDGEPRPVTVVDAGDTDAPALDLRVEFVSGRDAEEDDGIHAGPAFTEACRRVVEAVQTHSATLVFAPSRGQVEQMVQVVNHLAGSELVAAHHGSISKERRRSLEVALKDGELAGIVCTSSLEMGIDVGTLDLVICYGSPRSVASALQRIGRSGHRVGGVRKGRILSPHPSDLLESAAIAEAVLAGDIEPAAIPDTCLDVLAQQVVASVSVEPRSEDDLLGLARRAAPFRHLSGAQFANVVDMLEGRYHDERYRELEPRLLRDTASGKLHPRRGARLLAVTNGGTIPDRGDYAVRLDNGTGAGPRIGELDEDFVGDLARDRTSFVLGTSSWRVTGIDHTNVHVVPAPGDPAAIAFWNGEKNGRGTHLGRRVAALTRELAGSFDDPERLAERLVDSCRLDDTGASTLAHWLGEQVDATGVVPSDTEVVVEWFHDEIGDLRIVIHSLFGYAVNGAWAHAIKPGLRERFGNLDPQVAWTSDGVVLRLPLMEGEPDLAVLDAVTAANVGELLLSELADAPMYALRFRESAQRALLLPRPSPVRRTPLWLQRQRAADLLSVVRRKDGFPVVHEAVRECYQEMWDLDGLRRVLRGIESGEIRRSVVASRRPSPMAAALDWTFMQAFREDGDAPRGECRAAYLSLNRELLAEVLEVEELRGLLDPVVVAEVRTESARTTDARRARDEVELLAILTDLGDLDDAEIAARCELPDRSAAWVASLAAGGAVVAHPRLGRWVAAADAHRSAAHLAVRRATWAAPVTAGELAARYGLPERTVANLLDQQVQSGSLVAGHYLPGGAELEWCPPETLARLHRRSLVRARSQIAAVPPQRWASFVQDRQLNAAGELARTITALRDLPLPVRAWEQAVLPARHEGFRPDDLDAACAGGNFVWWGRRRGLVAVTPRGQAPAGWAWETGDDDSVGARQGPILSVLRGGGGWFAAELGAHPEVDIDTELCADSLFSLLWHARVGTDTFAPMRWWLSHSQDDASPLRGFAAPPPLPGRWQGIASHSPAHDAAAVADALLDRYGVACKQALRAERRSIKWIAVYRELSRREWRGEVVRGLFVSGLEGSQFARARDVDALRDHRPEPGPVLLAGCDPANLWGRVLALEERPESWQPRRPGSFVVTDHGRPVLVGSGWGRRLWPLHEAEVEPHQVAVLRELASRSGRTVVVEQWDGGALAGSRGERLLGAAGFQARSGVVRITPEPTRRRRHEGVA